LVGYCFIATLWVGLILIIAAVLDFLYRDIDPELWLVGLPPAISLGAACLSASTYPFSPWLPYIMGGILVLLFFILYYAGYIGGADLGAATLLWLGTPAHPLEEGMLPGIYGALLYSIPFIIVYMFIVSWKKCGLKCIVKGVPMKGWKLVEEKWWAPRGYKLELDVHELVAVEGLYDRMVRATPLMPLVAFLAAGYIAYLLLGDRPLLRVLQYFIA